MQLVFSTDNSIISVLIKYFTGESWLKFARVSHAALRFGGNEDKWMVEAIKEGFCANWWYRFNKQTNVKFQFDILDLDETVLEDIIDECIDEFALFKYDFRSILGLLIIIIWYKLTGKKMSNPFGSKNELTCTEVIYKIFKRVEAKTGVKYFEDQNPETIFPEDMLRQCESTSERFRKIYVRANE